MRMKIVLLGTTLIVILAIWSALEAGHQKEEKLTLEFALQHPNLYEPLGITRANLPEKENVKRAQNAINVRKRLNEYFVNAIGPGDLNNFSKELGEINDFERKKSEGYITDASLPYLKTSLKVNTLILADIWPFVLVITLVVLIAIYYRQRAYELILSFSVFNDYHRGKNSSLASAEFLVGELTNIRTPNKPQWLYRKSLVIFPESLLSLALAVVNVLLSLKLMALYNPTALHKTSSILFSYYSVFWTTLFVLGFCLRKTRYYFENHTQRILGGPVHGYTGNWMNDRSRRAKKTVRRKKIQKIVRILGLMLGVAGIGSLALPFVSPWRIRGYQLLLPQAPIRPLIKNADSTIKVFRIDPSVYWELRTHIIAGILFLIVWISFQLLLLAGAHRVLKQLANVKRYFAYIILFLIGNFFLYLSVLQFESIIDPSPSVLESFFPPGLMSPRGMSLIFTDPAYGAWFFIFTCLILSLPGSVSPRKLPVPSVGNSTACGDVAAP